MRSEIKFLTDKLKKDFEKLETEDPKMYKFVKRALEDIENNVFCGIQVPKNLIPDEYKKLGIRNLWKYNLPDAWRLTYSIENINLTIVSLVLEWLDHKNYERRFKY